MNPHDILLIILFLYLAGEFFELKGLDYPLLKVLFELIVIILILVLSLNKKEFIDKNQKKLRTISKRLKNLNNLIFNIYF